MPAIGDLMDMFDLGFVDDRQSLRDIDRIFDRVLDGRDG
jgi:hypothetical protein